MMIIIISKQAYDAFAYVVLLTKTGQSDKPFNVTGPCIWNKLLLCLEEVMRVFSHSFTEGVALSDFSVSICRFQIFSLNYLQIIITGLIGRVVSGTACGIKSRAHRLSCHCQCTVPVILSAVMPASALQDRIAKWWEGEQYLHKTSYTPIMADSSGVGSPRLYWRKGYKTRVWFCLFMVLPGLAGVMVLKQSSLIWSEPDTNPPFATSKPTYLLTLNWRHKRLCIRIGHYGAIQMLYYYYYYYKSIFTDWVTILMPCQSSECTSTL